MHANYIVLRFGCNGATPFQAHIKCLKVFNNYTFNYLFHYLGPLQFCYKLHND
jgi:hypothetical protein